MKLPNGYGTVYKLTGNRRRPWVVKKTIDGRQRPLGYFANREEAFAFLVSVNRMTPGKEITFSALYHAWSRRLFDHAIKELNMHHTPHECRHTLATMLDRSGANETAVKMILGHARTGVTKGVYTHKTLADLRKAINKV